MADDQIQEKTERLRKKTGKKIWDVRHQRERKHKDKKRGKIKELEKHANETETRVE